MSKSLTPSRIELYDALGVDDTTKVLLDQKVQQIRSNIKEFTTIYYEMGRQLLEAKEIVPHGKFVFFVEQIIGIDKRMAEYGMQIYKNLYGIEPETLERFTFAAAVKSTRKAFPESVRERILIEARGGKEINERLIDRYISESNAQQGVVTLEQKQQIEQALQEAHKQRKAPVRGEKVYSLPEGIIYEPTDETSCVSNRYDNTVGMYIGFFANTQEHTHWMNQEFHNQIARTLAPGGSLIVICDPMYLKHLYYAHSSLLTPQMQIIGMIDGASDDDMLNTSDYVVALWFTKGSAMESQIPIHNLIASDAKVEDGAIVFGINEAYYMLEKIATPNENIINLSPLSGQAVEAAHILGLQILFATDNTTHAANVAWRMSGYNPEKESKVETVDYTEDE